MHKLLLIIIIITGLFSCQQDGTKEIGKTTSKISSSKENNIPTVSVVHPTLLSFDGEIKITGTAAPNKIVKVHAMESGVISWIKSDIGDYVKQGQTIALLNNPGISREIKEAEINISYKKKTYDRLMQIWDKTPALTHISVLEKAEGEYKIAQSKITSLKDRSNYLSIRAPFSGIVSKRYVEKGTLLQNALDQSSSSPVIELIDLSTIRLVVYLPESDVAYVKKGTPVNVIFPELGGPIINAKVTRTSGSLDAMSKTLLLEIDLQNRNRAIKPGMFAEVTIELKNESEVLSLPHMSSVIERNSLFVYVVKDGIVKLTPIKKGLENTTRFQIISGISKDDLVIISGKSSVHDGIKVQAIEK